MLAHYGVYFFCVSPQSWLGSHSTNSDILCEAGAVSQVDENREPQSFPMENYGQSQSPGHDILEQSIFSPPTTVEETTLTNTDWDLYRLLLTEMGHREVGPTNVATIDIQVTASEATQPPDSANVNDAFTFWSDASTAYSRCVIPISAVYFYCHLPLLSV